MLNHIHCIATSDDIGGFVRDFKRFTSTQFKSNLKQTEPSVLRLFIDEEGQYHFWLGTNAPRKVENYDFYLQKLKYIHENPVRKSYVSRPEHWILVIGKPRIDARCPLSRVVILDLNGQGMAPIIERGRIC